MTRACECGCGEAVSRGSRFRHGHWAKANRSTIGDMKRKNGPVSHGDGYLLDRESPGAPLRLAHVLVAERALGKPLPLKAVVHHVNGNRSDNRPENLVICPDDSYHSMIHRRMRALAACGRADWRKCQYCKRYDAPENLSIPKRIGTGSIFHNACLNAARQRARETAVT